MNLMRCLIWLCCASVCLAQEPSAGVSSAALKRFRSEGPLDERYKEFYSTFKFLPVEGLGLREGVSRRDPTSIIKVGELYYVWYTRPPEGLPLMGLEEADETHRAFPWDLADIWYATSPDGWHWTERGVAATRGPQGSFDARSVFTPDVLVANGRYYLFYKAAGSLEQGVRFGGTSKTAGDFRGNCIGMSWADSPDGPWNYLMRFDCDLSLESGEQKRKNYEELQQWRRE